MKKRQRLLTILVIISLGLTACSRAASTGSGPTPTTGQDPIETIFSVGATLTAQVAGVELSTTEEADVTGTSEVEQTPNTTSTIDTTLEVVTATTTPITTLVATQSVLVPTTYTLHKGEYPYCIARRFNIDASTLVTYNNLDTSKVYGVGLQLNIPPNAASFGGARTLIAHPTQYTVQFNDTVYRIACIFGDVYPESIAEVNSIGVGDPLTVGDIIQIP